MITKYLKNFGNAKTKIPKIIESVLILIVITIKMKSKLDSNCYALII